MIRFLNLAPLESHNPARDALLDDLAERPTTFNYRQPNGPGFPSIAVM